MVLLSVSAVVGVAVGLAIAFGGAPSYQATATVLLTEPGVADPGSAGLDNQQKLQLLTHTYVEVVTSESFVDDSLAGSDPNVDELAVAATAIKSTAAVEIVVSAPTRQRAADAATALVSELQDASSDLLGDAATSVDVLAIDSTEPERVSTQPVFVVLASLVAALVIAGMFALLLETQ